jgi:hypothetical protein
VCRAAASHEHTADGADEAEQQDIRAVDEPDPECDCQRQVADHIAVQRRERCGARRCTLPAHGRTKRPIATGSTRRFARLSTDGLFCVRARGSDSGHPRAGFGPSSSAVRASPFPAATKASDLDFLPHGRLEISTSSVFPAFRPSVKLVPPTTPSADFSAGAFRPAQFGIPNTTEISRGKTDRLRRTPAGFTTPTLDDRGLRDQLLARPAG